MFNDVRTAAPDASNITFYAEVGFLLAKDDDACAPASTIWLHNPSMHPGDLSSDEQGQYHLPIYSGPSAVEPSTADFYDSIATPSVFWWGNTMVASGRIIGPVWTHTHRVRDAGIFLYAARWQDLLLCEDPALVVSPGRHMALRGGVDGDPSALRGRLLNKAGLVCHSEMHVYTNGTAALDPEPFVTIHGREGEGYPEGSRFDRSSALICSEWSFTAGDAWSVVHVHEPNWDAQFPHVPMHTFIDFYYEPKLQDEPTASRSVFGQHESFNMCGETSESPTEARLGRAARTLHRWPVLGLIQLDQKTSPTADAIEGNRQQTVVLLLGTAMVVAGVLGVQRAYRALKRRQYGAASGAGVV